MKSVVIEMVDYFNCERVPVLFEHMENEIGRDSVRTIVWQLLVWLRSPKGFFGIPSPLFMNMSWPWCRQMRDVALAKAEFSELFLLSERGLIFQGGIKWLERMQIGRYVCKYARFGVGH